MSYITLKYDEKVMCGKDSITFVIANSKRVYKISDIMKLAIITTDKGPFVDDVALEIFFDKVIYYVPSEHSVYKNLIFNELGIKFELDYEQIIRASTCSENCEFVIYKKV